MLHGLLLNIDYANIDYRDRKKFINRFLSYNFASTQPLNSFSS